jgi:hypothetical protein
VNHRHSLVRYRRGSGGGPFLASLASPRAETDDGVAMSTLLKRLVSRP